MNEDKWSIFFEEVSRIGNSIIDKSGKKELLFSELEKIMNAQYNLISSEEPPVTSRSTDADQ